MKIFKLIFGVFVIGVLYVCYLFYSNEAFYKQYKNEGISVIDYHTGGEPARIVIDGIPKIPGNSIAQKKEYLAQNMDHLRTTLMFEPRGHKDMFGAIIVKPTSADADYGIIFMDNGGYLNMCGHNTIAAVTAIIENKMIKMDGSKIVNVTLDTPVGLVYTTALLNDDFSVKEVSFQNVPSFLYKKILRW